ncbi:ankyrin-1 [Nematostella vectensis]|uniref:ankyrin-1 n=1 Tax=Nematostella vectensis TaxID=45351 RepID=UPI0020774339|nr:ankyrin-1 [Nematostella vectensis]
MAPVKDEINLRSITFDKVTFPDIHTGYSPLQIACIHGNHDIIMSILACSPNRLDIHIALSAPVQDTQSKLHGQPTAAILQNSFEKETKQKQGACKNLTFLEQILEHHNKVSNDLKKLVARHGDLRQIKKFLSLGIDINQPSTDKDDAGTTFCMLAAASNTRQVLEYLIQAGCNIHAHERHGNTALHFAASTGNTENARCLLLKGAAVDQETTWGRTPLHVAAKNGNLEAVKLLLDWGAKIDSTTVNQDTALILAAEKGHIDVVEYLLQKSSFVNQPNLAGCTALHFVAKQGHLGVARLLIQNGSSLNAVDKAEHQTPLFPASGMPGNKQMVQLLLEQGSECHLRDKRGRTPLHFAGDREIAQLLVQYRSDPELRDYYTGSTPIFHAAANGITDVVDFLIDQGFNGEHAKNSLGENPLHDVARSGHVIVAERLIQQGCDVNLKAMLGGVTPLILAALAGKQEMIECLIEHGAIVNDTDNWRSTALHKAVEWSSGLDTVKSLLRHGADVNARDGQDETPANVALRLGKTDVYQLLVQHKAVPSQ